MTVIRVAQEVVEVLANATPKLRVAQAVVEVLANATPKLRVAQLVVEVLHSTSGAGIDDGVTVAGTAAITMSDGLLHQLTKSIDATAALSLSEFIGRYDTLSIEGVADIAVDFILFFNSALTVAGTAALALVAGLELVGEITISAVGAFDSPGGLVHELQRSIEGISDIAVLDGFSYEETVQIDGTGEISVAYVYVMEHFLSIDGTSEVTPLEVYTANVLFSIAGTANCTPTTDGVWYESIGVAGTCTIFIENVFDVLLVSAVIAGFSATVTKTAPGEQNPSAVGSFSAAAQCVFNRPVTQTLTMVQSVILKKPTWIMSQTFSMTQSATCSKIHTDSVTHTLSLTQDAVAVRAISQSLVLTHEAECTRVQFQTVIQTFAPSNIASRNTVLARAVTQTVVYNPPNLQRLPIYGSNNQLGNHQFEYYVPNLYVVLVPRNCLIILGVPAQTVILPCPIWGDSQAYQGEISLKRAMTGLTYTYVKKAQTQKLHYSFELWTYKMLELRSFFIDHAEEVMTLQNHNAETWLVHLVNNPLEFTTESRWQPKGEKYNVTLEFEGVKIGG